MSAKNIFLRMYFTRFFVFRLDFSSVQFRYTPLCSPLWNLIYESYISYTRFI